MDNIDDFDAADFDLEEDEVDEGRNRHEIDTMANNTQTLRPNLLVNQDIKFSAFNFTTNKTNKKPVLPLNGINGRKARDAMETVPSLKICKQANSSSPGT
jgi:hypothetical protein